MHPPHPRSSEKTPKKCLRSETNGGANPSPIIQEQWPASRPSRPERPSSSGRGRAHLAGARAWVRGLRRSLAPGVPGEGQSPVAASSSLLAGVLQLPGSNPSWCPAWRLRVSRKPQNWPLAP